MAVYGGQAKRKRTTVLVAVATLAVGLVLGVVIGRATAPTIDDKVADGRAGGRDLVSALQVLPLEYSQARSGSEGTALIGDTVERAVARLNPALDDAPWLGPAQRRSATQAVRSVTAAADRKVAPAAFQTVVDKAAATVSGLFGLSPPSPG
jgi:hypothetical protein